MSVVEVGGNVRRLRLDLFGAVAVLAVAACVLSLPAAVRASSVLVVTTTSDSGVGSLRQAIADANASPGNTIDFSIPTSDPGFNGHWFVIQPLTALPALTQSSTTIDGSTQTGNTNPTGPAIELDGRFATGTGLTISSSNDVIRDLSIDRFQAPPAQTPGGIQVNGSQTLITQCFIGVDPAGVLAGNGNNGISFGSDSNQIIGNLIAGNSAVGIGNFGGNDNVIQGNRVEHNDLVGIDTGGSGTLIGGTGAGQGNLVSGNGNGGIGIEGSGVTVQGNLIGTDATGESAEPNGGAGIGVVGGDDTIGGTTAAARNVISGNGDSGISIGVGATGSVVEGNYLGTDATGALALGNQGPGVDVQATNTTIGVGNVISGNAGNGVNVDDGVDGTVVQGNYIGTNAAGTAALGNVGVGIGIDRSASNTVVGGTDPGAGNVISANRVGIDMTGGTTSLHEPVGTTIQGNMIGTDATGTYALGNTAAGIGTAAAGSMLVGGAASGARNLISGNQVGLNLGEAVGAVVEGNDIGTNLAGAAVPNALDGIQMSASGNQVEANTIADNGGDGVDIYPVLSDPMPVDDTISRNSIFSNGNLGIDLNGDGPTLNNCCGHSGPNDYENFPVLTSAVVSGGHVTVVGALDTATPHTAVVELFANAQPDPGGNSSGYGEGAVFLGSVTPAANGSFTATLPSFAPGALISATATDSAGNTSEFAQDIVLTSPAPPVVSSFSPSHGTTGTSVTITGSGFAGASTVAFGGTAAQSFAVGSDSTITATVAAGTSTGSVSVTAPGGTTTSSALFYLPPTVGGSTPGNAAERGTVTVTGTNLLGATQVKLGGVSVPFSVMSNTRLTFTVPVGSAGGAIQVIAPGGSATGGGSLTILPPPTIISLAPLTGPVGTTVTITGTNLAGTVGVMLGSVITVPTSLSATSVTFTIPPGAASGHVRVLTTSGSATSTDTLTVTG